MESRRPIFGTSRAQAREQLLMDIVEPAVTENHDHVFWTEHRNDTVVTRYGVHWKRLMIVEDATNATN